ncbi:TRAP transporter small permease subunit [Spirulina major CS-329]|uniref:TRAP transporter small permease subunit n=1 Tax=Spirulina TaxID=1154 RepID=UPI00232C0CC4|nr:MULTISPECIES: TRAP transporter small permease subunit [Spirulina]MDB9493514.1 TRAP transporter small permease subunit [Spirulina subsalsa CS-330]MDB9504590.1 TRAP transporter small permease subunit [Spirulina major CS-329]
MLPQRLTAIARRLDHLNEWVGRFAAGLVLIMVGVGVWNVVGRYLGRFIGQNLTSNALIEIQWYLFDLVFLLGAAYTLKHNDHVRVDVLFKRWSPKTKAWANAIGVVCFLMPFSLLVIYFSWSTVVNSWAIWEMSPDPGGLPRYPIKTMILVSFALLIIQGLAELCRAIAVILTPENHHGL